MHLVYLKRHPHHAMFLARVGVAYPANSLDYSAMATGWSSPPGPHERQAPLNADGMLCMDTPSWLTFTLRCDSDDAERPLVIAIDGPAVETGSSVELEAAR